MATINVNYNSGVFRPVDPVNLPEGTEVEVRAPDEVINVRALVPPGTDEGLIRL